MPGGTLDLESRAHCFIKSWEECGSSRFKKFRLGVWGIWLGWTGSWQVLSIDGNSCHTSLGYITQARYLWKPMGPMGVSNLPSAVRTPLLGSSFPFKAIAMLQHLLDATPRGIYWGYLSARARALNLPHQTPETWLKNRATFEVVAPIVAEWSWAGTIQQSKSWNASPKWVKIRLSWLSYSFIVILPTNIFCVW